MSTLWGITTFFNPTGAQRRVDNYRRFREASARQGLRLATAELVFDEGDYALEQGRDAELLVRRRTSSVLWQKERLLNLALAALPADCSAVCWIDADILFEDDDWIEACQALLRDKIVLQPFSAAVRLPEGGRPEAFPGSEVDRGIPRGVGDGTFSWSLCARRERALRFLRPSFTGTPGYAWCARRSFLDEVGFYDRCIVGGADREFALAFSFAPSKIPERHIRIHHARLRRHIEPWHARVHAQVDGRVGHRPGVIHHLWHGSSGKRNYVDRHAMLAEFDFDPTADIELDAEGCWAWAKADPGLIEALGRYFDARRDDGSPAP